MEKCWRSIERSGAFGGDVFVYETNVGETVEQRLLLADGSVQTYNADQSAMVIADHFGV